MVDVPRHPEPSDKERLHTYLARMTPGGAGGQSRAVGPVLSRVAAQANVAGAGSEEDTLDGRSHYQETLKAAGAAPAGTYQLTFDPIDDPYWPQVFAGGTIQRRGTDWSISGQTLTVNSAMRLRTSEVLECDYDYLTGIPTTPTAAVEIPASNPNNVIHLLGWSAKLTNTYDGRYDWLLTDAKLTVELLDPTVTTIFLKWGIIYGRNDLPLDYQGTTFSGSFAVSPGVNLLGMASSVTLGTNETTPNPYIFKEHASDLVSQNRLSVRPDPPGSFANFWMDDTPGNVAHVVNWYEEDPVTYSDDGACTFWISRPGGWENPEA